MFVCVLHHFKNSEITIAEFFKHILMTVGHYIKIACKFCIPSRDVLVITVWPKIMSDLDECTCDYSVAKDHVIFR